MVSSRGHEIAAQIGREDKANVSGILGAKTEAALARHLAGHAREADYKTICAAFFAQTYPVSAAKERNPEIMDWIIDRYLFDRHNGKQILLEDIYKIGDRVKYFNGLKASGSLPANDTLVHYACLKDLDTRLAPFETRRAKKAQERLERHMPAEFRVKIMAETTIIYSGKAGDIVLPHTPFASQYWGNNTKWCVSGWKMAKEYFPEYNEDSPIIMFLPKNGEKMALAQSRFWNVLDEDLDIPNPDVAKLWNEAAFHDKDMMTYLARYRPEANRADETPENSAPQYSDMRRDLPAITTEEKKWVRKIVKAAQSPNTRFYPPETIAQNKSVILHAVCQNGSALKFAASELRIDKEVVLAAVRQDGATLHYEKSDDYFNIKTRSSFNKTAAPAKIFDLFSDHEVVAEAIAQAPHMISFVKPIKDELVEHIIENAPRYPKLVLRIHNHDELLKNNAITEEDIFQAQARAIDALLAQGKDDIAREDQRFVKAFWGDAKRIFGKPQHQQQQAEHTPPVLNTPENDYNS